MLWRPPRRSWCMHRILCTACNRNSTRSFERGHDGNILEEAYRGRYARQRLLNFWPESSCGYHAIKRFVCIIQVIRREHLDQDSHHARWRVELSPALSFGARKPGEEILVDAAESVLGSIRSAAQSNVANQVDDLPEALLVEACASKVFRQYALQRWVVALDRRHRIVDQCADGWLGSIRFQVLPTRLSRHPKDAGSTVIVRIFGIGAFRFVRLQIGVFRFEGVRNVLEENQAKDDVLIFSRVHVIAERVRGGPKLGLKAEVGGSVISLRRCSW